MRALLLALLVLAPFAIAQEGRMVERAGWTQFLPEWQQGPATFAFGERNVTVPNWTSFATDGVTWLYGSNETPESLQTPREGCAPADNITAVVITTFACSFAKHPSIVCAGTSICDAANGELTLTPSDPGFRPRPGGPPATVPTDGTFHPGPEEPRQPTPGDLGPDCRMLTSARCTPGPGALGVLLALSGAGLLSRRRS